MRWKVNSSRPPGQHAKTGLILRLGNVSTEVPKGSAAARAHPGLHPGGPPLPRLRDPAWGGKDHFAKSQGCGLDQFLAKTASSLSTEKAGEGRKRRFGEHISKAQRPSDRAQNHIAFGSETHGIHSLPVTHGLRNQGKSQSKCTMEQCQ